MLTFKPTTSGYIVEYNAEYLGELARDASGYFVFWPGTHGGTGASMYCAVSPPR